MFGGGRQRGAGGGLRWVGAGGSLAPRRRNGGVRRKDDRSHFLTQHQIWTTVISHIKATQNRSTDALEFSRTRDSVDVYYF